MSIRVQKISVSSLWDVIEVIPPKEWRGIILHHSAFDVEYDQGVIIDGWHLSRGWKGVGYHFIVNRSGSLEVTFRWIEQIAGAHCPGYNKDYIGICLGGNLEKRHPTRRQEVTLELLLAYLDKKIMIPHGGIRPTLCPGKHFPWHKVIKVLLGRGECDRRWRYY